MPELVRSLKTALRVPFLRNILLLTLFSVALVPLHGLFVSHPQYEQLLVSITEDEAARVARHLSQVLHEKGTDITQDRLPSDFVAHVQEIKSDFKLVKLKVFSAEGVVVYSTAAQDIGKTNEHAYFKEIVAQGRVFSKVVQKETRTAENQVATVDVVETYQPIMLNGRFLGAFELYYDITDRMSHMDQLELGTVAQMIVMVLFLGSAMALGGTAGGAGGGRAGSGPAGPASQRGALPWHVRLGAGRHHRNGSRRPCDVLEPGGGTPVRLQRS